ncbi:hypothetical protein BV912_10520 [Neisseria dumasiana]|uniref:Uncharacterized protein n=1 Tax=Neisseria dumasiana TaxID=1931275 RepID=A0A1X3DD46_9NEIS|nr:hypothetical protein BV912_10520 [Neisseria dumasiana]
MICTFSNWVLNPRFTLLNVRAGNKRNGLADWQFEPAGIKPPVPLFPVGKVQQGNADVKTPPDKG